MMKHEHTFSVLAFQCPCIHSVCCSVLQVTHPFSAVGKSSASRVLQREADVCNTASRVLQREADDLPTALNG